MTSPDLGRNETGEDPTRGFRYVVVYEVDGVDEDAAASALRKLDKAAERLSIGRGVVDIAGPVGVDR